MLKTRQQLAREEAKILASYACKSSQSKGRVHQEKEDNFRTAFQRDRDRICYSKSFRRLQAKTQVFVSFFGDHYRDRLTHSIEVSQIGRDLSRSLGLNEDLTEALCLAHDLGHPPFGHGGESALNEVMAEHGSHFEHNEQSRRIIMELEKIYPDFDGLNCTVELLDGLLKHNPHSYQTFTKFKISSHLEGQVMDLSDELAYLSHDIDDGLRSGIIKEKVLENFELWNLAKKAVIKEFGKKILSKDLKGRFQSRVVGMLIHLMLLDLQTATIDRLQKNKIKTLSDVRKSPVVLVEFSTSMRRKINELRLYLLENFYLHPQVHKDIMRGQKIIKDLFRFYFNNPKKLPLQYQNEIAVGQKKEIVIKDYIAGMTDNYAISAHSLIK